MDATQVGVLLGCICPHIWGVPAPYRPYILRHWEAPATPVAPSAVCAASRLLPAVPCRFKTKRTEAIAASRARVRFARSETQPSGIRIRHMPAYWASGSTVARALPPWWIACPAAVLRHVRAREVAVAGFRVVVFVSIVVIFDFSLISLAFWANLSASIALSVIGNAMSKSR